MKVLENTRRGTTVRPNGSEVESFLDMETIRRRVATIKNRWTPEMAAARANEGLRRRVELESLVLDLLTDTDASEATCDLADHGFSLVG